MDTTASTASTAVLEPEPPAPPAPPAAEESLLRELLNSGLLFALAIIVTVGVAVVSQALAHLLT